MADAGVEPFYEGLWKDGQSDGATRAQHAEAWFRWLASHHGQDREGQQAASQAWKRFWDRADAGDVAGARAALASLPASLEPLFVYERGWLAAQGA